ncbi:unnamed protein product [Amoebophrya sp. A120]|nr:unnamed protein product [Amoebophrya sp. A120]|eukprot:GSA120T00015931001.1
MQAAAPGGGMQGAAAGPQLSQAEIAVAEMKGMADCFSKLQSSCYAKCIPNVKEPTLSAGEQSCVDRCVSKYLDVHQIVGKELAQAMQNANPMG